MNRNHAYIIIYLLIAVIYAQNYMSLIQHSAFDFPAHYAMSQNETLRIAENYPNIYVFYPFSLTGMYFIYVFAVLPLLMCVFAKRIKANPYFTLLLYGVSVIPYTMITQFYAKSVLLMMLMFAVLIASTYKRWLIVFIAGIFAIGNVQRISYYINSFWTYAFKPDYFNYYQVVVCALIVIFMWKKKQGLWFYIALALLCAGVVAARYLIFCLAFLVPFVVKMFYPKEGRRSDGKHVL